MTDKPVQSRYSVNLDNAAVKLGYPEGYAGYLNGEHWRAYVRENRTGECFCCGRRGLRFNQHHLTYVRLGKELPEDTVTVCEGCHGEIHRRCRDRVATLGMAHLQLRDRLPLLNPQRVTQQRREKKRKKKRGKVKKDANGRTIPKLPLAERLQRKDPVTGKKLGGKWMKFDALCRWFKESPSATTKRMSKFGVLIAEQLPLVVPTVAASQQGFVKALNGAWFYNRRAYKRLLKIERRCERNNRPIVAIGEVNPNKRPKKKVVPCILNDKRSGLTVRMNAQIFRDLSAKKCGHTRQQLKLLGVDQWPLPKGWKERIIGKVYPIEVVHEVQRIGRELAKQSEQGTTK